MTRVLYWLSWVFYGPLSIKPYRPQSGHIRPCCISPIRPYPPGKTAVFPKKVLIAHRGPIYKIKADEMPFPRQKTLFRFDKCVCIGRTLNSDISSTFSGISEGIRGNPREIPHIG